jgi:hypothetical protein
MCNMCITQACPSNLTACRGLHGMHQGWVVSQSPAVALSVGLQPYCCTMTIPHSDSDSPRLAWDLTRAQACPSRSVPSASSTCIILSPTSPAADTTLGGWNTRRHALPFTHNTCIAPMPICKGQACGVPATGCTLRVWPLQTHSVGLPDNHDII